MILALDNIRSAHNVGAILRTALAFDIQDIITIGLTPHFATPGEERLPHVVARAEREIAKTALGGETLLGSHFDDYDSFLTYVDAHSLKLWVLDHSPTATALNQTAAPSSRHVLVLGNEVDGVNAPIMRHAEQIIEIPTPGPKKSLNVASAASIALYALSI